MADKKISQLTPATIPLAGTELLPIVQSGTTDNITVNNLAAGNVKSNATTGVLQVTGPAAASTRVMTTPDANFTVARTDAGQTFSGDNTFNGTAHNTKFQSTSSSGYERIFVWNDSGKGMTSLIYGSAFPGTSPYGGYAYANLSTLINTSFNALVVGNAENYPVSFIVNGNEVSKLDTSGNLNVSTGNLVIGTSGKGITTGSSIPLGLGTNNGTSAVTVGTAGNVIIGTATQVNSSQFQTKDNCVIATDTAAVSRQYDISKYSTSLANNTALDLFVVSRTSASVFPNGSVLTGTLYISIHWVDTGGGQSTHSYSAPIGIGATNSNNLTFNIGTPYDFKVRNGGASADTITIDVSPASTTSTTIRITASSATYPISSGVVSARFVGCGTCSGANFMFSVVPA